MESGEEEKKVELVGEVNSPGGSLVCYLPATTCEVMNEGRVMPPEMFLDMIVKVKGIEHGLVGSRLFDGYAGPWESFLRSLVQRDTLRLIRRKGEWSTAYTVVERLSSRFDYELVNVLVKSNVTRSFVDKLFNRKTPRPSQLISEIMDGKFLRFGQSKSFFERVRLIKGLLDHTLVEGERVGFFIPHMVTSAQRTLALGAPQVVGAGPGSWQPVPIKEYKAEASSVDFGASSWHRAASNVSSRSSFVDKAKFAARFAR